MAKRLKTKILYCLVFLALIQNEINEIPNKIIIKGNKTGVANVIPKPNNDAVPTYAVTHNGQVTTGKMETKILDIIVKSNLQIFILTLLNQYKKHI